MERIKLNLIPSGVAPVVHVSQYDDGREFAIDLFEGDSVYTLDGTETLTVNVRKPDGHLVTESVTNTSDSYVVIATTEQMTACHGTNYAKLEIAKGGVTIGTLEFLMAVSRDPLENGDPSETTIHNLQTQVAGYVATEVANQYDSANVIFDPSPVQGHGNGYAVTSEGVKTEVDTLNTAIAGKVNTTDFDATNLPIQSGSATNTKDYIDSGLSGKADKTITCKMVQTTLTYNSTLNRFTLPSGVTRPVQPQQCLIGRNSSTGSIYALWYVSTDENFQIGATLSGSAPANGNTCYVNYTVPNT